MSLPLRVSISVLLLAMTAWSQAPRLGVLRQMLPPSDDDTHAIVVGDIDGDHDLDIIVGNTGPNRLLRNDGSGVFEEDGLALPTDTDETKGLALGDLDGDGDLDLIVANGGPNYAGQGQPQRVLLNDGHGRFTELSGAIAGPYHPSNAVALADVDLDGDLDALFVHGIDCTLFCRFLGCSLYENDGSGRFQDITATRWVGSMGSQGCGTAAVFGDVDADGDLDAIVGGYGPNKGGFPSYLYRNDGSGRLVQDTVGLPLFSEDTLALHLADIDGDGDLDLLESNGVPNGHGAPDRWVVNDGAGNFTTYLFPWGWGGDSEDHAIGDVDADGDLDILVGDNQTLYQTNPMLMNQGGGVMVSDSTRLPPWIERTRDVELVDVDADGDLDALVFGSGLDHLHLNDGTGQFFEASAGVPPRSVGSGAIGVGDFDADGNDDLLLTGSVRGLPRSSTEVLRGAGTGVFENAVVNLPDTGLLTQALALGDVDGDGAVDALLGSGESSGGPRLWLGDGAGGFRSVSSGLPVNADGIRALALADFDGDGELDALLANRLDTVFWHGLGDGSFHDASSGLPSESGSAWDLAIGDVDHDGDLDALFAGDDPPRLWLNDGRGHWSDASSQLPLWPGGDTQVELFDADGDGDLDIAMASLARVALGRNDGAGRFSEIIGAFPALTGTAVMVVGDADDDGDFDLLLGRGPTNQPDPRFALNDSSGSFSQIVELPVGSRGMTAAHLGDLDGDGDTDVLICSADGPDLLYSGLRSHLAQAGLPRIGQLLRLELFGEAHSPWELAIAHGELRLPAPPFGTLYLDPRTILATTCGHFDASGASSFALSIPSDPAFLGVRASWQLFQHAPPRLSNLERTVPIGL